MFDAFGCWLLDPWTRCAHVCVIKPAMLMRERCTSTNIYNTHLLHIYIYIAEVVYSPDMMVEHIHMQYIFYLKNKMKEK